MNDNKTALTDQEMNDDKTVLTEGQRNEIYTRRFCYDHPNRADIGRAIEDTERAVIAKLGHPAPSEAGAVPASWREAAEMAKKFAADYSIADFPATAKSHIDGLAGFILAEAARTTTALPDPVEVKRLHYVGKTIPLWGYRYVECRFEDCTFENAWGGMEKCLVLRSDIDAPAAASTEPPIGEAGAVPIYQVHCATHGVWSWFDVDKLQHDMFPTQHRRIVFAAAAGERRKALNDAIESIPSHDDEGTIGWLNANCIRALIDSNKEPTK